MANNKKPESMQLAAAELRLQSLQKQIGGTFYIVASTGVIVTIAGGAVCGVPR